MNGKALVFSLQARNISNEIIDLSYINVAEITLNKNHTFIDSGTTPTKCSQYALSTAELDTGGRESRGWVCVRPRTTDYPFSNVNFNETQHIIDNNIPFGYAFAYGEGQFYQYTMHSSRGTCGMYFEFDQDEESNFNDVIKSNQTGQSIFECFQKGQVIGTTGQAIDVNIANVPLPNITLNGSDFIQASGYNISHIPYDDDTTSTTTTTEETIETTSDSQFDGDSISNTFRTAARAIVAFACIIFLVIIIVGGFLLWKDKQKRKMKDSIHLVEHDDNNNITAVNDDA